MASINYTNWIEVEPNSEVITQLEQNNPFLGRVRMVPMSARQKVVDRSVTRNPQFLTGNNSRPADYPVETGAGDKITLTKEKIGDRIPLDEDEVMDMQADVLRAEVTEAAIGGQHVMIRAITFGDSGARSTLSVDAPFDSVWSTMRYGRNPHFGSVTEGPLRSNIKYLSISETPTYDDLVDIQAPVDRSKYARRGRAEWFADAAWRAVLMKIKDEDGLPMLGTAADGLTPMMLGAPINFCHGMEVAPITYLPLPFLSGNGIPAASLGVEGDLYINLVDPAAQTSNSTKSLKLFRKDAGSWQPEVVETSGNTGNRLYTGVTDFSAAADLARGGYVIATSASGPRGTTVENTLLGLKLNVDLAGVNAGQQITTDQFGLAYLDPAHMLIGGRERPRFRLTGSDASDAQDDLWLKYRERLAFGVGRQEAISVMVKRFSGLE